MDSCHIFNFLFGTKRATTELSRRFSSLASDRNRTTRRSRREMSATGTKRDSSRSRAPPSPLKQLQMKLVSFASGSKQSKVDQDDHQRTRSISCDAKCGTYRATLVESTEFEDDDKEFDGIEEASGEIDALKVDLIASSNKDEEEEEKDVNNNKKESFVTMAVSGGQRGSSLSGSIEPMNSKLVDASQTDELVKPHLLPQEYSQVTESSQSAATKCKRVVLYADCEPSQHQDQHRQLLASAEVYSIVSGFGEARAKLRRVSSISNSYDPSVDDAQGNNCRDDNDDSGSDDKLDDKSTRKAQVLAPVAKPVDDDFAKAEEVERLYKRKTCESSGDNKTKRSVYVRSLVQSIETNGGFENEPSFECKAIDQVADLSPSHCGPLEASSCFTTKPITIVKPLPPKTPPKTNKAKCLNLQLSLNKPMKIQQLFQDEKFLTRFFDKLEPLDRCVAAQVCREWRRILYAERNYWKDLVSVIDCIQLRRELLVECIINTLQSAKLKTQQQRSNEFSSYQRQGIKGVRPNQAPSSPISCTAITNSEKGQKPLNLDHDQVIESNKGCSIDSLFDFDQDEVWRIQELCNRFTQRGNGHSCSNNGNNYNSNSVTRHTTDSFTGSQATCEQQSACIASKSSSIPSQISSTLSSVSLSSLLSPLSESSRIESMKEKLYTSIDNRGFDAIGLFGATDEDIEDLVSKIPMRAHKHIIVGRLNNCCLTNRGLELFISTFNRIEEIELSGCNELTNSFELTSLKHLKRLIITDCINIADGIAQKLAQILAQLDELTIQAYHLTDNFLDYLSLNSDTSSLRRLELPNCKEITNKSLVTIAKHFPQLEALSISGSTKISDEGVEILAEQSRQLKSLDLSWCSTITDASLECIACDLCDNLTELILDRNIHITDIGLGYLATMNKLTLLHIRWCSRISDIGLESVLVLPTLKYLSLAGIHQVTARSLLCLVETNLLEVELTNCPAVNNDLLLFLSARMPSCNIIF